MSQKLPKSPSGPRSPFTPLKFNVLWTLIEVGDSISCKTTAETTAETTKGEIVDIQENIVIVNCIESFDDIEWTTGVTRVNIKKVLKDNYDYYRKKFEKKAGLGDGRKFDSLAIRFMNNKEQLKPDISPRVNDATFIIESPLSKIPVVWLSKSPSPLKNIPEIA